MTISSSSSNTTLETSSTITTVPLNTLNRNNRSYGKSNYKTLTENDASITHHYHHQNQHHHHHQNQHQHQPQHPLPHNQYLKLNSKANDVNSNSIVRTTFTKSSLPTISSSSAASPTSPTSPASNPASAFNVTTKKFYKNKNLLQSSDSVKKIVTKLPSLSEPQSTKLLPNSMPLGDTNFILLGQTHNNFEKPLVKSKEQQNNLEKQKTLRNSNSGSSSTCNFDEITFSTLSANVNNTLLESSASSIKSLPSPRLIPEKISKSNIQTNFSILPKSTTTAITTTTTTIAKTATTTSTKKNSLSSLEYFENHNGNIKKEEEEEFLKNFDNNFVSNCDDCYQKINTNTNVLEKKTNLLNDFNNHTVLSPGIEKFHPQNPKSPKNSKNSKNSQNLQNPLYQKSLSKNFFNLQYQHKHQRPSPSNQQKEDQFSNFSKKESCDLRSLPITNLVTTPSINNNLNTNLLNSSPTKNQINKKIYKANSSSSSSSTASLSAAATASATAAVVSSSPSPSTTIDTKLNNIIRNNYHSTLNSTTISSSCSSFSTSNSTSNSTLTSTPSPSPTPSPTPTSSSSCSPSSGTVFTTNITKTNFNFYDNSNTTNYFRNNNHLLCNGNGNGNSNTNSNDNSNTFLTNDTDFDDTNLRPESTYILPSTSVTTSSGGYPSPSPSSSPSLSPSASPTSFRFLSSLSLLQPSSSGSSNAFLTFCQCWNNLMTRCCFNMPQLKAINVRRCVLALLGITLLTIVYYTHYVDSGVLDRLIHRDSKPPEPIVNCRMINGRNGRTVSEAPDHRSEARLRIDAKVLVFVETVYSNLARDIAELLVYNRIKYKIEVAGKSLPVLTNLDKGRYGVIVFENFDKYLNMDKWNRELLDKYCREYSVGIVGFVSSGDENLVAAPLKDFPIYVHTNLHLRDASLNPASPVLRLTRAGETAWGALPGDDWAVFQYNHTSYEPIEWAQRNTQDYPSDSDNGGGQIQLPLTTILQDHGYIDGIKRVLFGSGLRFWLHRLVFLDALSYLSHGQLSLSLDRMILVDIDDIFVGEKGTRLRPDDVRALVATQKIIASMVPGFRFNLGFSGKYYHHGTREENLGDDYLLQNVQEFNWFSHMWKHQQPHLYDNITLLMSEMQLNYAFAKDHNIPTDSGYSISPHHSGVYPAHEILYEAWKKVWNVRVTSTEEYPHLRPARLRRGFIHRNIMVLPRQTCGLFTHTMYIDRYPGGRDKLDESIQGGELFQTIVYNPINIFMTHMSNYGSDRLALYTFQSVIKFLQCWTNLKLASAPPIQLAEMYFKLHPEEIDPVWGNPCDDARHKKIWSKTKNCDSLPKFLVIGPQKTGTTALYTFLSIHPGIASNVPSADTFEEIQFFNGNNYYRGLDWYMDFFPIDPNTTTSTTPVHSFIFEKSATYFDGEMVPKRAHALLPHAKIVSILISPAKRAYSWYQHQRAHGDMIANNYSFYQVITASDSAPKGVKDLRNRCLNPGKYAQHLEHWLGYYPAQQLHVIDGEQLRSNPIDVMNDLQRFLKIQPIFDYTNHLRFDVKKGFFCIVVNEKRNKCLGKSKGRQYPSMDERSTKILQRYYQNHNTALVKLLKKLGSRPIPQWLKDDLSTGT